MSTLDAPPQPAKASEELKSKDAASIQASSASAAVQSSSWTPILRPADMDIAGDCTPTWTSGIPTPASMEPTPLMLPTNVLEQLQGDPTVARIASPAASCPDEAEDPQPAESTPLHGGAVPDLEAQTQPSSAEDIFLALSMFVFGVIVGLALLLAATGASIVLAGGLQWIFRTE